jgi:hypothetical protein
MWRLAVVCPQTMEVKNFLGPAERHRRGAGGFGDSLSIRDLLGSKTRGQRVLEMVPLLQGSRRLICVLMQTLGHGDVSAGESQRPIMCVGSASFENVGSSLVDC